MPRPRKSVPGISASNINLRLGPPTLRPELDAGHGHDSLVCGVDEAGRGPLAGPVVAAAVILPVCQEPPPWCGGINDSKKLTPAAREALFDAIRAHARVGVGISDVEEIDTVNILQATFLAMSRAVAALTADGGPAPATALVDGNQRPAGLSCRITTLVSGDALSLSIAAASIIAKVTRDRLMADLALSHPGYGWERNAGYGTAEHRDAIKMLGVTPVHRRTFAPISEQLALNL
ncbi:ribonuclease HII [Nitrospirillum iridis]|uniref:Ribonuclease HII n=1 Tax=Nitrospirillum iridis TaxID=765888 RepID=A0A7X0AT23_9PROT|nr:ribonuclease HII [Nitrospirillum iridis]MBB6249589.1 ribonuclease HII [Nitrospirillum iridis]